MIIWLDAHLSPRLAPWIADTFVARVFAVQSDPQLIRATDVGIFEAAREAGAVVMTKDRDFVDLVERLGPPPQVLWVMWEHLQPGTATDSGSDTGVSA